jgi:RNA polymerase sigma-70 factor (ECF subfamily)
MEVTAALENEEAGTDFGGFFEANVDRARRLAWRLVGGDEAAAEDVVQNAFIKAYRNLARFRGESRLESWFYRIVVNETHNYRRWRRVRDLWQAQQTEEPVDAAQYAPGDPGLRQRISVALEALSSTQRDVFVLVHFEGFTVREAAEVLGRSEGTVKTHLRRALQRLREELADLWEETSQ